MEIIVIEFFNKILNNNLFLTYSFFFTSCLLQLVFPPFPSDVVLIFQGYATFAVNNIYFLPVFINAICGTMLGSFIVYRFGYTNGIRVFEINFIKKYIDEKHRNRAEKLFKKYGAFAIFLSKFVPGVNAIIILLAGVFRMNACAVMLPVFSSVVVHHLAILMLGRYLGYNIEYVKGLISTYNWVVSAVIISILLIYLVYRLFNKYLLLWIKTSKVE